MATVAKVMCPEDVFHMLSDHQPVSQARLTAVEAEADCPPAAGTTT